MCLAPRYISGMTAGPSIELRNSASLPVTPCASIAGAPIAPTISRAVAQKNSFRSMSAALLGHRRQADDRRRARAVGSLRKVLDRAIREPLSQSPNELLLVAGIACDEAELGELSGLDVHLPGDAGDAIACALQL